MTGGAFRSSSNLLGRRREIEELEGSVKALSEDLKKAQESVASHRKQRNVLREQMSRLMEQLQKKQLEQNTEKLGFLRQRAGFARSVPDTVPCGRKDGKLKTRFRRFAETAVLLRKRSVVTRIGKNSSNRRWRNSRSCWRRGRTGKRHL